MFEYIFTIGCFDKFQKGHIKLLENMKKKSNKIIIGLYDNYSMNKFKNIDNNNSYDIRKKKLEKYTYDIFKISDSDPTKSIQEYISKKFYGDLLAINIGSSKINNKTIENTYKGNLFFINNFNDTFNYSFQDNNIIITRTDKNDGWCQDLIGYTKNWCFFIPKNYDYSDTLINCINPIGMSIMNIEPILMYNYDILEKFNKMKIDWIVGWINPDEKNNFYKDHNIQRLRDNNELLYFLKSIYKYADWINKIYILLGLNSKPPKWLKCNNKIVLIQETSLYKNIQKNSETKKLFYGMIPNISDLFIAGDDDYLLGDYIYKSEFFTSDNIPIVNHVNYDKDGGAHIPIAWNKISYNEAIINNNCSYYLNMDNKRKNPWTEIKYYLLKKKMIINGNKKSPDVWINNTNYKNNILYFNYIKKYNPKYICINDDWEIKNKKEYEKQFENLNIFYKSFLPEKYDFIIEEID